MSKEMKVVLALLFILLAAFVVGVLSGCRCTLHPVAPDADGNTVAPKPSPSQLHDLNVF